MQMYFRCICGEEGDLHVLLLHHLEGLLTLLFHLTNQTEIIMQMLLIPTLLIQTCGGGKGVAERAKHCFIFLICKACPQQHPPSWQDFFLHVQLLRQVEHRKNLYQGTSEVEPPKPIANQPWNGHILLLSAGGSPALIYLQPYRHLDFPPRHS